MKQQIESRPTWHGRRAIVPLAAGAALLLAAVCRAPATSADPPPDTLPPPAGGAASPGTLGDASPQRFAGPQSCMATACHGKSPYLDDASQTLVRGAEYTFWRDTDPHARAGATLRSDASRRMLAALNIETDLDIQARCGACHSPHPPPAQQLDSFAAGQGVTCEDCHGASERWRHLHFRGRTEGMTATKRLDVRAELCAGCHVGESGREVSHELLAAGHPVLQFEMASHHSRLPKHWDELDDRRNRGDFETRLWAHGQRQLLRRATAEAGELESDWRLAALDCYGCHRELAAGAWRTSSTTPQRLGALAWRPWGHAMAPAAVDDDTLEQAVARLAEAVLERRWRETGESAAALQSQLAEAETVRTPEALLGGIARRIDDPAVEWTWDAAAQAYLAAVAAFRDLQPRLPGDVAADAVAELETLRASLQFPPHRAGPRAAEIPPAELRTRLRAAIEALREGAEDSSPTGAER